MHEKFEIDIVKTIRWIEDGNRGVGNSLTELETINLKLTEKK